MTLINYSTKNETLKRYNYDILFIDANNCLIVLKLKSGRNNKTKIIDYLDSHNKLSFNEIRTYLANEYNMLALLIDSDKNIFYYEVVNYNKYYNKLVHSDKLKLSSIKYADLD